MNIHDGLPAKWNYLKLDLFDNATEKEMLLDKQVLKLAISFRRDTDTEWNYFRAKLNSPIRNFRRGVADDWDQAHYDLVRKFYDTIHAQLGSKLIRMNASKCYSKGYAQTKTSVEGLSVVVFRDQTHWNTALIVKDQIYLNQMTGAHISQKARRTGIIAQYKGSTTGTVYKRIKIDDFL